MRKPNMEPAGINDDPMTAERELRLAELREAEIEATRCPECQLYHGHHRPPCSLVTVESLRKDLESSQWLESHNRTARDIQFRRMTEQLTFWQGKFHAVKHENNRLRRRLNINVLQPTVRERAIEALKQLKGFDLNLDPEEAKKLYDLNIRSLAEDFTAATTTRQSLDEGYHAVEVALGPDGVRALVEERNTAQGRVKELEKYIGELPFCETCGGAGGLAAYRIDSLQIMVHRYDDEVKELKAQLAEAGNQTAIFRAVLEGAEFENLDKLANAHVDFARMVGQAAAARMKEKVAECAELKAQLAEAHARIGDCLNCGRRLPSDGDCWGCAVDMAWAEIAELQARLAEAKKRNQRLEILGAQFAGRLAAESMEELAAAAGRAVDIQGRIEGLEAKLADTTRFANMFARKWKSICDERDGLYVRVAELKAQLANETKCFRAAVDEGKRFEAQLAVANNQTAIFWAVLEGAEFENLDKLANTRVDFARTVGQAAAARMKEKVAEVAKLRVHLEGEYGEEEIEDMLTRDVEDCRRAGQAMADIVENHMAFAEKTGQRAEKAEARYGETRSIASDWTIAALKHYPQGWTFDATNPEGMIANVVRGVEAKAEARAATLLPVTEASLKYFEAVEKGASLSEQQRLWLLWDCAVIKYRAAPAPTDASLKSTLALSTELIRENTTLRKALEAVMVEVKFDLLQWTNDTRLKLIQAPIFTDAPKENGEGGKAK